MRLGARRIPANIRPSLILRPELLAQQAGFTRASVASYWDAAGVLQTAGVNVPRIDYDPATGARRGVLFEGARSNLLLNSAALATQSVTVTAVAHTLTFFGTGTVTLSGASTAGPLVGAGANVRSAPLTFTPSAGSLTLTVSGSVTNAALEVGSFATSPIITGASQVTRAAEGASSSQAAQAGGFSFAGSLRFSRNPADGTAGKPIVQRQGETLNDRLTLRVSSAGGLYIETVVAGVAQANLVSATLFANTDYRWAFGQDAAGNIAIGLNGVCYTGVVGVPTGLAMLRIGTDEAGRRPDAWIDGHPSFGNALIGFARLLSPAEMQAMTA